MTNRTHHKFSGPGSRLSALILACTSGSVSLKFIAVLIVLTAPIAILVIQPKGTSNTGPTVPATSARSSTKTQTRQCRPRLQRQLQLQL